MEFTIKELQQKNADLESRLGAARSAREALARAQAKLAEQEADAVAAAVRRVSELTAALDVARARLEGMEREMEGKVSGLRAQVEAAEMARDKALVRIRNVADQPCCFAAAG
jgi:phage shock protein A